MDMNNMELETDPKKVATQAAMMKLLGARPEPILAILDRLEIPWERKVIKSKSDEKEPSTYLVIKWSDLMAGERKLQQEPTYMQRVAEEVKKEVEGL